MQILIVILNCMWLISLGWIFRRYTLIIENNLSPQFTLVTAAFAGLNMLLALMLIFDLMESTPNDIISTMINQNTIMTWLIFYSACFAVNLIFGIRLVSRRLNQT